MTSTAALLVGGAVAPVRPEQLCCVLKEEKAPSVMANVCVFVCMWVGVSHTKLLAHSILKAKQKAKASCCSEIISIKIG